MVTQSQTPMAVERRPWWAVQQTGFSWVVEVALVVALLAGTWYAVTQVQDREATIATQAVVLSQQTATVQQTRAQLQALQRTSQLDGAIIDTYGQLQIQRAAMEQALRSPGPEAYDSYEVAEAGVAVLQQRIDQLLAQRQLLLSIPAGFDT